MLATLEEGQTDGTDRLAVRPAARRPVAARVAAAHHPDRASDRTDGKEKLAWILAVIFISWFAWIFYLLLAPLQRRARYEARDYRY